MRRSTPLDCLPLATALALCAGLFWWAGHDGARAPLLAAEAASPPSPYRVEVLARADSAPLTPWGDRSLDELLERIFDPPILREEASLEGRGAPTGAPDAGDDAGSGRADPPVSRWVQLRGADGRTLAEGRTLDGVPDGPWDFRDRFGRRQAEGLFRDGLADGDWLAWREDQTIRASLHYERGRPEGLRVEWWPNGVKALEGRYVDGLRSGPWSSWHETGALRSQGYYEYGLREGDWGEWHPDGSASVSASYAQGRREGHWRSWHANGNLAEDGWFVGGLREGPWGFFTPDGKRERRSGTYHGGALVRE